MRIFRKIILFGFGLLCLAWYFLLPQISQAATFGISPSTGKFTVGSTFEISVFVNSEGQTINAVESTLLFPPDKLQLVSPSAGKSVIGVWTAQPSVNNQTGKIDFQGGIPGGINVSSGLVTTLTFRVKAVGQAIVRFADNSKILLHDGKGTNILTNTTNGVYELVLPPPQGPVVASETHPVQEQWYKNPNAIFSWAVDEDVEGYSYILNQEPVDLSDDIIDSKKTSVIYKDLADGTHYFHIKSFRSGSWGGVTHFALKIDNTSPADFKIKIIPSARTVRQQPIIDFSTTDAASGVDHYELKIVSLDNNKISGDNSIFIEINPPYVPSELALGKYDVIVRAYDKAGNFQEKIQKLSIVSAAFEIVTGEGIQVRSGIIIPWKWFLPPFMLFLIALLYLAWRIKAWHRDLTEKNQQKSLPETVKRQLDELNKYRRKYGKIAVALLLFLNFSWTAGAFAESTTQIAPPLISTFSKNITNEDIFYVGGQTELPNMDVVVYVQNLQTGEVFSSTVQSDKKGEWFYRHTKFLLSGSYLVWSQGRLGQEASPPSPQQQIVVKQTAMQFGSNRISYEFLYLILMFVLLVFSCVLLGHIFFHAYHGRKKHKILAAEIRNAEESIKRGFAVLRRDIEAEVAVIKKARLSKSLSEEEKQKEEQLIKDLESTEKYLTKEIWKIEQMETNSPQ